MNKLKSYINKWQRITKKLSLILVIYLNSFIFILNFFQLQIVKDPFLDPDRFVRSKGSVKPPNEKVNVF